MNSDKIKYPNRQLDIGHAEDLYDDKVQGHAWLVLGCKDDSKMLGASVTVTDGKFICDHCKRDFTEEVINVRDTILEHLEQARIA